MITLWPFRLRCLLGFHDSLLTQRRSDTGLSKPHALVWVCRHCQRLLGETVISYTPPTTPLKVERLRGIVRHANAQVRRDH